MPLDDEVRAALDTIFSSDSGLYRERGWNRRSGVVKRAMLTPMSQKKTTS